MATRDRLHPTGFRAPADAGTPTVSSSSSQPPEPPEPPELPAPIPGHPTATSGSERARHA